MRSPLWGGDIHWIGIRICSPSSSIFPSLGSTLRVCGRVCVAPVGVWEVQSCGRVGVGGRGRGLRGFCCHMSLSGGLFVPGPACLFSLSSESCLTHRCLMPRSQKMSSSFEGCRERTIRGGETRGGVINDVYYKLACAHSFGWKASITVYRLFPWLTFITQDCANMWGAFTSGFTCK